MQFHLRYDIRRVFPAALVAGTCCAILVIPLRAQGPTPETAATLFPGGAFVSYNSVITSRRAAPGAGGLMSMTVRPTFQHQIPLTLTWGFHRDWQIAVVVPIVHTRFEMPGAARVSGTGLGDTLVLLKYRFLRLDSERGTTQASFTAGPKLPTGRTNLRDANSARLPVGLQPGTGSTDAFLGFNWTYTGLFNIRKLVADESLSALVRTRGSQQMRMGSPLESRFWLSYRPYESPRVDKEWWIGADITWMHMGDDSQGGTRLAGSGGNALLAGAATYFSPRAGMELWFGADFPVAQTSNRFQMQMKRRISFGITQQFRLHR